MFDDEVLARADAILARCRDAGCRLATAESCTGGLIAGALTEIAGSSAVVDRGFVTYSNEAKEQVLGVPRETLDRHGAVSEATARAMAAGAIGASEAEIAVAVTGIAGPDGGSPDKPVGLVHLACARRGGAIDHRAMRYGAIGRGPIRRETVLSAFEMIEAMLRRAR